MRKDHSYKLRSLIHIIEFSIEIFIKNYRFGRTIK